MPKSKAGGNRPSRIPKILVKDLVKNPLPTRKGSRTFVARMISELEAQVQGLAPTQYVEVAGVSGATRTRLRKHFGTFKNIRVDSSLDGTGGYVVYLVQAHDQE